MQFSSREKTVAYLGLWRLRRSGRQARYLRNIPGKPPPMRAIIFENLPIFFIICCICANLFSIVFNSATVVPLPLAMR
jgi:hypothetical protein